MFALLLCKVSKCIQWSDNKILQMLHADHQTKGSTFYNFSWLIFLFCHDCSEQFILQIFTLYLKFHFYVIFIFHLKCQLKSIRRF